VLSDLVRWFHDAGVRHARLSFRPNNPGTNQLFGSVVQRLPAHLAHLAVVDYALVAPEAKRLPRPAVDIERLAPADAQVAVAFYSQLLHPVELAALHLDELALDGLAASFADHGLHRRRRVLVATGGSGVLGACIVNEASEGINFSFLENAIEHLRVAPRLSARRRRQVWLALAAAALDTARASRGRGRDARARRSRPRAGRRSDPGTPEAVRRAHGHPRRARLPALDRVLRRVLRGPASVPMSTYIMESRRETERLREKTDHVLLRRHLDWAGLRPGESFLDVGCATGEVLAEAARIARGARVVGIDAGRSRLNAARETCGHTGAVELHEATIAGTGSSGLASGAFDHAWTRFLLEYQPDPETVVRELARVVRRGGKVTLIDLQGNGTQHFGMPAELRQALDEILADIAQTGFDPDVGAKLPRIAAAAGLVDIGTKSSPTTASLAPPSRARSRTGSSSSRTSARATSSGCSRTRPTASGSSMRSSSSCVATRP
jgi:SAM-dependent methyltransferase